MEQKRDCSFTVVHGHKDARVGKLQTSHGVVETPCWVAHGTKGGIPGITPDMMDSSVQLLQFAVEDFFGFTSTIQASNLDLHNYVGLPDKILYLGMQDPSLSNSFPLTKKHLPIQTASGRGCITPQDYVKTVLALKPDLYCALAHELPFSCSRKQAGKVNEITLNWLDAVISQLQTSSQMFGVIHTHSDIPLLQFLISKLLTRNDKLFGYVLSGIGNGDSFDERVTILTEINKLISPEKPRLVIRLGTPIEVLQAVSCGIDLFNSTYPDTITLLGYGLTFPIDLTNYTKPQTNEDDMVYDIMKINLRDPKYKLDAKPVISECACYCCQNHSKAYIHHLLNTHEMLAQILLQLHNIYHYNLFFSEIRKQIKEDKFSDYHQLFTNIFS